MLVQYWWQVFVLLIIYDTELFVSSSGAIRYRGHTYAYHVISRVRSMCPWGWKLVNVSWTAAVLPRTAIPQLAPLPAVLKEGVDV